MDLSQEISKLGVLYDLLPPRKYKEKIVDVLFLLNKVSTKKVSLRGDYCKHCRTRINIVDNRTSCTCKRYYENFPT